MRSRSDAGQFSLAAIMIALALVGVLTAAGIGMLLTGNSDGGSSLTGPGTQAGTADDISAKTTLNEAQTDAATASATGGYGAVTAATLAQSGAGIDFIGGPSTSVDTVSVASTGSSSPDTGGSNPLGSGGENPLGALGAAGGGASGGGSATLAVYSPSRTCWYVWLGSGGPIYGAMTGQSECQAPALSTAPPLGAVSNSAIGWQSGGFPPVA